MLEYTADKMSVEIAKVYHTDWDIGFYGVCDSCTRVLFYNLYAFSVTSHRSVLSSCKTELDPLMSSGDAQLLFAMNALQQFSCQMEPQQIS